MIEFGKGPVVRAKKMVTPSLTALAAASSFGAEAREHSARTPLYATFLSPGGLPGRVVLGRARPGEINPPQVVSAEAVAMPARDISSRSKARKPPLRRDGT